MIRDMETIALVVTIITNISSGAFGGSADFLNTYSINGFGTKAACEAAKPVEIARIQKQLRSTAEDRRVVAECVVYPAKK